MNEGPPISCHALTHRLQVREDPRKGVYIDAHEINVNNFCSVLDILNAGEKQRHVGCTEMNSRSSRSHTLFRLVLESQLRYDPSVHESVEDVDRTVLMATLNLVDLAGSESVRHTGATGQRQKEGGKINQSLLTLSRVIQTLSQGGNAHVNYRDSKLTRILQPSLSGNAGMAVICCATAAEGFLEETRSTFQFASRAKQIKTRAVVNEVVDEKAQLRRITQELDDLKRQQAGGGSGSMLVETLQAEKAEQAAKIERLKNLLVNIAPTDDDSAVHLDLSPRYRRNKRSRETWCPGESGSVMPMSLLGSSLLNDVMDEGGLERLRKRRSSTACTTPCSKAGRSMHSSRTPLLSRSVNSQRTLGMMSPARAQAQQQVAEMRERLGVLQAERDANADKAEAAGMELARIGELEQKLSCKDAEVSSLKGQLQAASQAAAEVASAAHEVVPQPAAAPAESSEEVQRIKAQLEEAMTAKEALTEEMKEFSEYTVRFLRIRRSL